MTSSPVSSPARAIEQKQNRYRFPRRGNKNGEFSAVRLPIKIALVVCLVNPIVATAGPDDTSKRFLQDSPSMMDWGAYRLAEALNSSTMPYGHLVENFLEAHGTTFAVSYNFEGDTIDILSDIVDWEKSISPEEAMAICNSWRNSLRLAARYHIDGSLFEDANGVNGFARYFGHIGFMRTIDGVEEIDALKELERKFRARLSIFDPVSDSDVISLAFVCEARPSFLNHSMTTF